MFSEFKLAIQRRFKMMQDSPLYQVEIDKDKIWETYLNAFPEGTNPKFRERTEHDCTCCKHFIRTVGGIVTIKDGVLTSIWDVTIPSFYQEVANALSAYVKSLPVENCFIHFQSTVGVDKNLQLLDGKVLSWEHFHVNLPNKCIVQKDRIGDVLGKHASSKDVFLRGLKELTLDSLEIVEDLIHQNSLYRGSEHLHALSTFKKIKIGFDKYPAHLQDLFCWELLSQVPDSISRFRNTVIGSLIIDLSEGKDLEIAVKSFEAKVAPANYKRPTSLVTPKMVEQAKEKILELGLASSLNRRFAVLEDITVNNVLFADRSARKVIDNVFDEIATSLPEKAKLDKVEEVSIEDFISTILPKAESLELYVENNHSNNFVSLIAPQDPTSKEMFKWSNAFSWSYAGEFADSIKERVKQAGGKVDGDLRCSLSWHNYDDLDLHMNEPKEHIYFGNRRSTSGGNLDVDMNAGGGRSRTPVENICYPDRKRMPDGVYTLKVHQYSLRELQDTGFEVEIEFDGVIHSFHCSKSPLNHKDEEIAKIHVKKGAFTLESKLSSQASSKTVWNLSTCKYHKVKLLLLSPNHWDSKAVGNKHYFFMLDDCINDGTARGFYNEFLKEDLTPHRKVLEIVGSKTRVKESSNQLSGLGFSSTQRNYVLCKVTGSFTRTIKINF